jgi:hypothetical protein
MTTRLRAAFAPELDGLSFAAALLSQTTIAEAGLLTSAMRFISHQFSHLSSSEPWLKAVRTVVDGLRDYSDDLYSRVQDLSASDSEIFSRLKVLVPKLRRDPEAAELVRQITRVGDLLTSPYASSAKGTWTVRDLLRYLRLSAPRYDSTVTHSRSTQNYSGSTLDCHALLLQAICDNLLEGRNTIVRVSIEPKYEDNTQLVLCIDVFYRQWSLPPEEEDAFLLEPLKVNKVGFYLTALVAWRHGGSIEYYPLGNSSTSAFRQALLRVCLPLVQTRLI